MTDLSTWIPAAASLNDNAKIFNYSPTASTQSQFAAREVTLQILMDEDVKQFQSSLCS